MYTVSLGSSFDKWIVVYVSFSYEDAKEHALNWRNYSKMADELGLHKSWNLSYPVQ